MYDVHDSSRWWAPGSIEPFEVDLMAESGAGDRLLVREVKWTVLRDGRRMEYELMQRSNAYPFAMVAR
jgi:hypothetical protein